MIRAADIYHSSMIFSIMKNSLNPIELLCSPYITLALLKHMQAQVNFIWNPNSELNHSGKCVVMFMFISNVLA